MAIDKNQTLNVYNNEDVVTEVRLKLNHIFVGHQDCIHGGTANLGRRLHGMFVPKEYAKKSEESETIF